MLLFQGLSSAKSGGTVARWRPEFHGSLWVPWPGISIPERASSFLNLENSWMHILELGKTTQKLFALFQHSQLVNSLVLFASRKIVAGWMFQSMDHPKVQGIIPLRSEKPWRFDVLVPMGCPFSRNEFGICPCHGLNMSAFFFGFTALFCLWKISTLTLADDVGYPLSPKKNWGPNWVYLALDLGSSLGCSTMCIQPSA